MSYAFIVFCLLIFLFALFCSYKVYMVGLFGPFVFTYLVYLDVASESRVCQQRNKNLKIGVNYLMSHLHDIFQKTSIFKP